jgi:hypothetical protein
LLNTIPLNEISEVISGTYTTSTYQSDDWNLSSEDVNWFLVFRVIWRDAQEKTTYTPSDIVSVANQLWLTYSVTDWKDNKGIEDWTYKFEWNTFIYNLWSSIDADKEAYKVRVIQLDKQSTLW